MVKSSYKELARQINALHSLIMEHKIITQAATAMVFQNDISKRQPERYIHKAQKIRAQIPIPELKSAFTVKLTTDLTQ